MQTLSDLISRDELMVPQIFSSFSRLECNHFRLIFELTRHMMMQVNIQNHSEIFAIISFQNEAFSTKIILKLPVLVKLTVRIANDYTFVISIA